MSNRKSVLIAIALVFGLNSERTIAQLINPPVNDADTFTTNRDLGLLVLANYERLNRGIAPMIWNDKLGAAARYHADDLAAHGGNCDLHNDCNGRYWVKRVESFYPSWTALGENAAVSAGSPYIFHRGWMESSGHRKNILTSSFLEMGNAISYGQTNFGLWGFGIEDFGARGSYPIGGGPIGLFAGAVFPKDDVTVYTLMTNYYDPTSDGAPKVYAQVGNSCKLLSIDKGTSLSDLAIDAQNLKDSPVNTNVSPAKASYATTLNVGANDCIPVRFQAMDTKGRIYNYPNNYAIGMAGWNNSSCAERHPVPTVNCFSGTTQPPAPTPTPVPVIIPPPAPTPTPTPVVNPATLSVNATVSPLEKSSQKVAITVLSLPKTKISMLVTSPSGVTFKRSAKIGQSGQFTFRLNFQRKKIESGQYSVKVNGTTDVEVLKEVQTSFSLGPIL